MSGKYSKTRSRPSFYNFTNPQCPKLILTEFEGHLKWETHLK